MKRLSLIIIVFLSCGLNLVAQYDAQLSNYWASMNYFNPAQAGQSGNLEALALYRQQWLGVDGAPQTTLISANMPQYFLGRTHGLGAIMFSEKIGLFSHSIVAGQYAYQKRLAKGMFSAGIQIGHINETFKGSDVEIEFEDEFHQGADEAIPTSDVSGSAIDVALGLLLSKPKWYVGISATHLTAPKLKLGENTIMEVPRAYYLTAGYNIQLNNPLLELRPALLIKTTEMGSSIVPDSIKGKTVNAMMTMTQIDLSVRAIYNKTFWGGLGWRKGDAVVVMMGGKFKMIEAGYAYDFPISAMLKGSTGSHELFIRYTVDLGKRKGEINKHKSVRIL